MMMWKKDLRKGAFLGIIYFLKERCLKIGWRWYKLGQSYYETVA